MIPNVELVKLNNGVEIPILGLGVHGLEAGEEMDTAVQAAVDAGYRMFDNAANYHNEKFFGEAIRRTGLKRGEYFLTTKLRNAKHKYEDALEEFELSRKALGVDYIDMYLIHFPCPAVGLYLEAWKALEHLYKEGVVRAIGVSNFNIEHLEKVFDVMEIKPVVNQFECNPYMSQVALRKFCHDHDIWPQAYFPLGGPREPQDLTPPDRFVVDDETLRDIGSRYGKTVAQVALRWEVQSRILTIPKSKTPARLRENIHIFDFQLTDAEMNAIDNLNYDRRLVPDPATFNILF